MNVSFINTDNLKFSIAFALEKALLAGRETKRHSMLYFFGPESEIIAALSELGWLRLLAHDAPTSVAQHESAQVAQEFISFQFVSSSSNSSGLAISDCASNLFLLCPSKTLITAPQYLQLIVDLQSVAAGANQIVFLDSFKHPAFRELHSPLQFFPVASVVDCIEHPASGQFELQQVSTKNILETVTVLRSQNDRLRFEKHFLIY